jgi:acyl-CoA thioester hydrolase
MTRSILVVDDDVSLVAPLKDGLESAGYEVAIAYDTIQGLHLARELKPDLIILDYYLPGGDGGAAYDRLRAAASTKDTPVIFSTGLTLDELKGKITPGAKTFFLRKPVGFGSFLSVINQVLGPAVPDATAAAHPIPPAKSAARKVSRHEFQVRVTYADTDKAGIIYYANYLKYLEQGRTELLRSLGVRYRDLEISRKLFLPAVESRCEYLSPSRYDDLLTIRTWISELGRASISFTCEVVDGERGDKVVAKVYSRHALVNDLWRLTRVPADLQALLAPFIEPAK